MIGLAMSNRNIQKGYDLIISQIKQEIAMLQKHAVQTTDADRRSLMLGHLFTYDTCQLYQSL